MNRYHFVCKEIKMSKLLIVGAGGHGVVVKEIAEDIGLYEEIAFVDDNSEEAIGKIADLELLRLRFDSAFVAIGNNKLRGEVLEQLCKLQFQIPVLIHPSAYVSKSAKLGVGTVVEPKAIVNARVTIAEGCIISVGAIIEHDAVIEPCTHINSGAICMARSYVKRNEKIDAGIVVRD